MIKLHSKKKYRGIKLTVCVASIYEGSAIIGAADRMITAGHIQYQPSTSKIWKITNSVAVMFAGDIQTQKVVYNSVYGVIKEKIEKNPSQWIRVKETAEIYSQKYLEEKSRSAERRILLPFGLTLESFIFKQKEMSESFVSEISDKILRFNYPDIETLIIGCDEFGPHIFSVDNDEVICHDSIGFAARGIGMAHAESHLMSNGYSPGFDASHALLYTHRAKRISEAAPGVGKETDIINIGPALGTTLFLPSDLISVLDDIYEKYKESIIQSDGLNFDVLGSRLKLYAESKIKEISKSQIISSNIDDQKTDSSISSKPQT